MEFRRDLASRFYAVVFASVFLFSCPGSLAMAAAPGAALLKAKKDAEAKGFIFESSHADIVGKAKKEGKLRIASTLDPDVNKAMSEAFKRKYPFIALRLEEMGSVEENQGFLLET